MPRLVPEIHWEDGLLLRPQHLQAFQRHCHGIIAQLSLARSFGYGIRSLSIREESVGNWIFEIESCELILPDGSLVVAGETAQLAPAAFQHLELDAPRLDVFLAVPLVNPAAPNVESASDTEEGEAGGRRYIVDRSELPDENTGSNRQEIAVQRLNARLFVGHPPPQGHVALKIAELKKVVTEGEEGRRYEYSKTFVPASLTIDASPTLHSIVKDVLDRVEEKNAELLGRLRGQRDPLGGESIERPETLLKLQATNSILPVLRQLAGQPEMHPFDVYLQLCRLVGDLAIFGDDWQPPRLVLYDHNDPLKAYLDFKRVVLTLLEAAVETSVERTPFERGAAPGTWEVAIPPKYLTGEALLLGIETELGIDAVGPLFQEGRTVLASPEELAIVRRARIEGVPCRADAGLHASLKDREGLVFLRIEKSGDFWPAVEQSGRLALAGDAATGEGTRFFLYTVGIGRGA